MIDANEVADRVAHVRSVISDAGGTDVSLIAVTKSFGIEALRAASSAELSLFSCDCSALICAR